MSKILQSNFKSRAVDSQTAKNDIALGRKNLGSSWVAGWLNMRRNKTQKWDHVLSR